MEQLKIPRDRIACLIGTKGETKKAIERYTNCKIKIDSVEGDVIIDSDDPVSAYQCREMVKAIGRGFNPKKALNLTNEKFCLDTLELNDYSRKTEKDIIRLRSRLIGQNGKARKQIERLSNTYLSIYGKTVCIIGKTEDVVLARKAIIRLLQGAKHSNVYRYIKEHKDSEEPYE